MPDTPLEKRTWILSQKTKIACKENRDSTRKVVECSDSEDYEGYETSDDEEQDFAKIDPRESRATSQPRDKAEELADRQEAHKEIILTRRTKDSKN